MAKTIEVNTRFFRLYPEEEWLGYDYEKYSSDLKRTGFLVVDVYGLGFHPEDPKPSWAADKPPEGSRPALSWIESADWEAKIVKESLYPALEAARSTGMPIIYVSNSAPKIGLKHSEFAKMHKRQLNIDMEELFAEENVDPREYHIGSSDHLKFSKLVEPKPNEYFVRKHVYSGFVGTRLDHLLRYLDIKTLFAVGFSIDACLLGTIIDALWYDYKVILLRDCTLANEMPEERKDLAFTNRMILLLEQLYCVTITSQEFIEACGKIK